MAVYDSRCSDCGAIFSTHIIGPICPACSSINITAYVPNAKTSNKVQAVNSTSIKSKDTEPKEYIIYYVKYGQFRVMHKDSHFYTHSQNLSELSNPDSGIRYYTASGAKAAIEKIRENFPEWILQCQKILNL